MSKADVHASALVPMLGSLSTQCGLRWSLIETESLANVLTKSSQPLDYGTLPESLRLTAQYLRPADNDVILINDPTSGANHTFELTLITPVRLNTTAALLGLRIDTGELRMKPGSRVPPIPIVQNRELVSALLEHLPKDWNLRDHLQVLNRLKNSVSVAFKNYESANWRKSAQKALLSTSDDWPHKDALFVWTLSTGDRVELHLDRNDHVIQMDFSATPASPYGGFTERMTLGLCLKAMESVFGWIGPTQVWTDFLGMHTKAQTLVNHKGACDLAVAWSHPLALEMLSHITRSIATWTHRPWKKKTGTMALLEWYVGDKYQTNTMSYLHQPWPELNQTLSSQSPLVSEVKCSRTRNEKGLMITRTFRVNEPCTLNFWFSEIERSNLKVINTAQKEEVISGQVSGAIQVAADELISVTVFDAD